MAFSGKRGGACPLNFNKKFEGSLAPLPRRITGVRSVYAKTSIPVSLCPNLWKAVRLLKKGTDGDCSAYVGRTDDGKIVAELSYKDSTGSVTTQVAVIDPVKGHIDAKLVMPDGTVEPYVLTDYAARVRGMSGTIILFSLFDKVKTDEEGSRAFEAVWDYASRGSEDAWDEAELGGLAEAIALLGDNIYRRLGFSFLPTPEMPLPDMVLEPASEIGLLGNDYTRYHVAENIVGTARFFTMAAEKPEPVKAAVPETAETEAVSTAEEDILEIDTAGFGSPDYGTEELAVLKSQKEKILKTLVRVSDWMRSMVENIIDSFGYFLPKSVFYLVGPAGCGKSFGTEVIASMLKLVRIVYGCQPDTDFISLFGSIIPNTECQSVRNEDIRRDLGLPTEDEIMSDVAGCAARLGLAEGASDAEVLCEVVSRINVEAARRAKDYTYVEGPVTKALKHGYFLEIQEAGCIRRPGVLVSLNALLEPGKDISVTLPTGEVVKKDPHCIIAFTSNDEYEGICFLNQSVLSRMADVVYFDNPSPETMAARAKANVTDFPESTLLKMAETVANCTEYLAQKDITSGVCGQRELTNWAMSAMSLAKRRNGGTITNAILREAAQGAVINKVAQDRESIAEVASAIFNPVYGDFKNTVSC